jgi:hypothetical protein
MRPLKDNEGRFEKSLSFKGHNQKNKGRRISTYVTLLGRPPPQPKPSLYYRTEGGTRI